MNPFKLLIPLVFLSSCAQIIAPEGGLKDVIAPICIKTSPLKNSINCIPKKIILFFDENIHLKNPSSCITVSPKINTPIDVKYSKNKIELTLPNDTLQQNTTYCINFGKNIMDVNEGNIINNFMFSFSTGPFLDTSVSMGSALIIKENKAIENALVSLTNTTSLNSYTTNTDKNGLWTLNNLANGNYNLLVFQDLNLNLKLDQGEYYAYKNLQITNRPLFIKSKLMILERQQNNPTALIHKYKSINDYSFSMVLNSTALNEDSIFKALKGLNALTNLIPKRTSRMDSFIVYNSYSPYDSLKLRFQTNDTIQDITIPMPNKSKKQGLTFTLLNPIVAKNDPLYIRSNIPVKSIKFSSLNSGVAVNTISPYIFSLMNYNLKSGYFIIEPQAILDINGQMNKGDTLLFKVASQEQTGNYAFTLLDSAISYTGPIKVIISNAIVNYNFNTYLNKINKMEALLPGKYTIEAWQDENNNGIWDMGNYYLNHAPEKIIMLKDFIQIKENWDSNDVNIYMD